MHIYIYIIRKRKTVYGAHSYAKIIDLCFVVLFVFLLRMLKNNIFLLIEKFSPTCLEDQLLNKINEDNIVFVKVCVCLRIGKEERKQA